MPREVIHAPTPTHRPFRLVVGWNREPGDVQIGIETVEQEDGQRHLVDVVYGGETEAIGRTIMQRLRERDLVKPTDFVDSDTEAAFYAHVGRDALDAVTGSTPFGTSVWVDATRSCLNTLIRYARRARDAAYGKDE